MSEEPIVVLDLAEQGHTSHQKKIFKEKRLILTIKLGLTITLIAKPSSIAKPNSIRAVLLRASVLSNNSPQKHSMPNLIAKQKKKMLP
jgi:hypothetical protein